MEEDVGRPEVLLINRYVRLHSATANIASALGFLALMWSTVVLLGGFIDDLLLKEFWVLTALSFLMAFRMAKNTNNELTKGIYLEEMDIIDTLLEQKWFEVHLKVVIVLFVVLVLKLIFVICFVLLYFVSPFVNLGVAVWRLVRRDYGDAGGDIGNKSKLNAALDIFYGLILLQSLFSFYYLVLDFLVLGMESRTRKHCGLEVVIVELYHSETVIKFKKDGELPEDWNLIAYGVEKLQSASGDDHLWGARVLDQLFSKDKSVRQKLLSSRISVQNLIGMIGLRGTADNVENRERAARIVAHLASDLNIAHFPGTLQCICSLLESCNKQSCEPQEEPEDQNGADTVLQIKDQTEYESGGPKELVSQGLLILEGLTRDKVNCTEISKQQLLISKITSPLSSPDFLNNVREDTMVVRMLSKSLTALSRILACPGDGATRLRQELASTTEAVSNLMAILEIDSGAAQELHGQALEILTELAFDDSFKKLEFNKLLKALLCIFLEENATRLMRRKAGEALARLLPVSTARERDVNVADIISKQEAINLLTKVLDQILYSKMGTSADLVEIFLKKQSPEKSEERKFMAAMLSLAVVICNENVISREDFARSTPKDAALAKKLKDILDVNKLCTAKSECLRVVKLTCQMVIAMIQAKPSYIQYFNEHNFKEALTETLGTMSEVDNCMLFARNDREVIKPARSLASLVKEAQELLKTAQEQGN
ncbi:hypothetical protein SETIT_2G087100v2 [Setaria italica]|uniref:Uncharacterized protein n=2 Tax=Setaria italica TaxID=4555 RepID=A0A368PX71_SETIT|nr:uncharacterized protein LOC101774387 [Setaria italica]RCV10124.1 hypothetical protein SETIT_2G087100v2 [Setaria italica]